MFFERIEKTKTSFRNLLTFKHTSFIFMVKARLILLCNFSGFPWYCFDMRSCSLRVQPPTARICRVKYSLSSGAELMVNGCHSCGPKEEKWVIGYSLSEQHILTPINPKYNDWFCQILQGNNYEIVVKIFHISHNLTWYSEIVHIFIRISKVCSTYELTKQFMEICVKNCAIDSKRLTCTKPEYTGCTNANGYISFCSGG